MRQPLFLSAQMQNANPAKNASAKIGVPKRNNLCAEYAARNDATRYIESTSMNPPSSVPLACSAIDPGPSSTTRQLKNVALKELCVSALRLRANVPLANDHAIDKPAATKPRLLHVFAGCLIRPGRIVSQNWCPARLYGPNQPLTSAAKKSASETSAVSAVRIKT